MNGVLVVGSINVDITVVADRVPEVGETITGTALRIGLGGKGANQALAVARAGASSTMVGCVGSDAFADVALEALRAAHVDVSGVRAVDGGTGVAHIRVADGENSIVVVPLANAELDRAQAIAAIDATTASVVLLQLEIRHEVVLAAAKRADERGKRVVLDPAPAAALPESVWNHVTLVTPNEHEASILTGVDVVDPESAAEAARWFIDRGVDVAIITLGQGGALFADRAMAAAALAVTRPGAADSIPLVDEVLGYLSANR